MASESFVTDQSIDEHAEEKKIGHVSKYVDCEEIIFQPKEAAVKEEADNSKEEGLTGMASTASVLEEKLEPGKVSVADVTKQDVQHEKVEDVENSLQESEVSSSSKPAIETNEGGLNGQADNAHETSSEGQENSSDFVETSTSQEPVILESKTKDLKDTEIKPTSEDERKPDEAPLVSSVVGISKGGNVEDETPEAAHPESSKDKVYIELIKPEDSKDEIQVLDPAEIPAVVVPEASDVVGKIDIDSCKSTSIEVPVKDLEVESGSPEEQKSKESTETKEPSSKASTINAGSEVFGSSSYEVKPSEDAEVVEKKDDGLEVETIQASAKIQEEPEAETKLAQTESNENASQGVEVKKDVEIVESGIETSTVPSLAEVSSEEAKASEPGVVVEEEETSLESNNIYTVPNVAEVLEDDKLVGKEKVVNAESVQRDLVDTITDPTESDVSSVQIKAPSATEIVNEALEVTSKELNIAPEASEVFSEGDQISAGDEKSENLKGEAATSVEAPSKITTAAESLDQVIEEKKTESSVSETQVLSRDKLVEKEEDVNDETKQINLLSQADGAHETLTVVQSDFTEKLPSQEPAFPESKTEDLKDVEFKPTSENDRKPEEAPLVSTGVVISKDGNVEDETQEAANPESSKDKDGIELIKLEDSKDEIQVLVSAETPSTVVVPDASEAPEKNVIDSSNFTSIEVPVKNLEVDSGSPDEQKSNEKAETKDLSSNVSAMNAGGEVVGSFSNETTPSGDVEVIEKKNGILEVETLHTSAKIHKDLEAKPELAQIHSDENVSVGVEVKKDDGIAESSIERSTVPDDIPLPSVSYEEEKASEPGLVVEEKETSLEGNNIDTVPKVAEVSFEGGNALEGNKLVDKEKAMNVENVERDLVDTITDPGESEVSSVQVNAPTTTETVNESLEVTSKEHDTAPEATEVPSDGDKLSAGDEKSENLNGEAATSVEAPKDISIVEEWLDQVIEVKKSENSKSESQAHSEHKLIDKEEDVNEEAKEINLQSQADGAEKTQRVAQSDFSKTSTMQEPAFSESKDLEDTEIKRTSENERKQEEAPLVSTVVNISEANNVVAETKEAASLESSKNKVDIELIKSEGSKDEIQVLVPDEIPTAIVLDASEAHKKIDVDSSNLIGIEAPVDDLEIESGSSEEQISKNSTEAKETSSVVNTIDVGGEVVGSTFYEIRPSGVAEVVEKKDGGLEVETIQTSVKIQEDLDAKPELAQTHSDENVSPGVEVKNDDETIEGSIVTSTVLDVPPLAKGLSEEEKASEPGVVVVEEGVSLESDNLDTVPKVAEVSSEGSIVLEGDKLVDKEEVLNAEVVERNLIDTFTDATKSEVSSDQVKSPKTTEIVNEALEVTSQDLSVAPEASEVPAEVDKISAGDEKKSESLIVGEATSVVTPKDIIAVKESVDEFFEEKSESLVSEMAALTEDKVADKKKNLNAEYEERDLTNASTDVIAVEVSSEQVKSPEIVEERDKQALEETSNVAPEVSEIPSADDKLSAGEEKIESLKGEAATSVETPKDITIAEESLVQVIEKEKNENLISEKEAPPEDKLVDREKNVNEEDEERDLVDTSTDPTAAEVSSDKVKPFETAKIIEEESNKQALKVTSKELNITSEASEIRSKGDEEKREGLKGEDATLVEAPKDITIAEESSDQVIEKSESSVSEKEALPENKLVDKEKNVNEEAEERDLVDTSTDPAAAEVSSDQVKFSETAEIIKEDSNKQAFKVTSKELNIPSETGEILSKGDEVSAGDDEKKAGLKGEDATLVGAPKDITIAEEFSDQVNEKSESSVSEREALPEYKLVDKEKNVNEEAEELDLFDTSTDPTAAEVSSDQVTSSETAEIIKEESIKHASKVTSKELNITSEASEIHSKGDEVSVGDEEKREGLKGEDATLVGAPKDITIAEESPDQVIEKSESLISEKEAPLQDKLVDKEENVNEEAANRDLVDTYTDPIAAEVSSDQVKALETAEIIKEESSKQASKVTSKELNIASEASEIPSKGDEVSAGDEEKREGLEGEDATLVEAPKDITIAEESPDQVIEISESSVSEKEALSEDKLVDKQINVNEESEERDLVDTSTDPVAGEVSFDQLKAFESAEITEESNKQALEETSKELNIASEASDVLSEGDEEKRESLNGDEEKTVMDAPKDIIIAKESLDKVIEKKIEISTSEKEGPSADKFVDKEKNVKEEVEERVFVETSTNPTAAEVSSDQVKASETAEIIKEESNKQASEETSKQFHITSEAGDVPSKGDEVSAGDETKWESLEGEDAIVVVAPKDVIMAEETSKEFSIASEARDVPSKGDEISSGDEAKRESLEGEDATVVVTPKDVIIAEESPDQGIEKKKSESSTSEKEGPPKDKLVDKEKNVNEEAEERELVDTSADPTIAEVSSSQLQASETVDILKEASNKPAFEITSKELNIASESIEVDNVSSGEEEKNESLKGEVATSLVPPNDITTEEKSIDQLIEENKNDSSKNETETPIETTRDFDISKLFPAGVKDIIASEAVEEKQDEISNDLSVAEKKANDSEDKKEEVKITDKPEQEDLVVEKAESEKSKDQDPIVSSESGNAKLTKEVNKRESNIFSKVKRSIVKAKKAILRKSPGPKTASSQAKD